MSQGFISIWQMVSTPWPIVFYHLNGSILAEHARGQTLDHNVQAKTIPLYAFKLSRTTRLLPFEAAILVFLTPAGG